VLLGQIAAAAFPGAPLAVAVPSIVQHVGAVSLCNPSEPIGGPGRAARNFPGVGFDARELIPFFGGGAFAATASTPG
jgi:hypothetical protein